MQFLKPVLFSFSFTKYPQTHTPSDLSPFSSLPHCRLLLLPLPLPMPSLTLVCTHSIAHIQSVSQSANHQPSYCDANPAAAAAVAVVFLGRPRIRYRMRRNAAAAALEQRLKREPPFRTLSVCVCVSALSCASFCMFKQKISLSDIGGGGGGVSTLEVLIIIIIGSFQ